MVCSKCLPLTLDECKDLVLEDIGLLGNTTYNWSIEDKFGRIYSGQGTTDYDGTLIIDKDNFPEAYFNRYAGTFIVEIETLDGTTVTFGDEGEFDCLDIKFKPTIDTGEDDSDPEPEITCENKVIYVDAICGDDTTGEIGNIHLAFKTIKAAVQVATSNVGQVIFVFPGTYSESAINKGSDAIEKRGLTYYFMPGVTVTGTTHLFHANSDTGSITVRGSGVLKSSQNVIYSEVVAGAMNWDIECYSIECTATSATYSAVVFHKGTFRLVCHKVVSSGNNSFNIRTDLSTGYVECALIDSSTSISAAAAVAFKNVTVAGTKWVFRVSETKSIATGFFATITLDTGNTGNPTVYYYGNVTHVPVVWGNFSGGVQVNTGTLYFEGDIDCSSGYGIESISGKFVIRNSRIKVTGAYSAVASLSPPGNGLLIVESCILESSDAVGCVYFQINSVGTIQMSNCLIKNSVGIGIHIAAASNVLKMFNCLIQAGTNGIKADAAASTQLWKVLSNTAQLGATTDLIEALAVDSSLAIDI